MPHTKPRGRAEGTRKSAPAQPEVHALQEERGRLIAMLSDLVGPIGGALPISSEVVLHDLSRLPRSIVAVHGDVTGRKIGDPATDLLLERTTSGELEHMAGYQTKLADGRSMLSTTMIIRDSAGEPFAALCINSDLSVWQRLERIASAMTGSTTSSPTGDDGSGPTRSPALGAAELDGAAGQDGSEMFPHDVDELAAHLIHRAIQEQGVPVELMRKEHKLNVVRALQARGVFLLRDAVEMIAGSLQVTRFTIYNYLNESGNEAGVSPDQE